MNAVFVTFRNQIVFVRCEQKWSSDSVVSGLVTHIVYFTSCADKRERLVESACIIKRVKLTYPDEFLCLGRIISFAQFCVSWYLKITKYQPCICVSIMNFFKGTAPAYSAQIFRPVNQGRTTRRSKFKLEFPFRKSNTGQKCLSYLGPKIWNSLPSELKSTNNINTFKHRIKENFFQNVQKEEDDIYVFY